MPPKKGGDKVSKKTEQKKKDKIVEVVIGHVLPCITII